MIGKDSRYASISTGVHETEEGTKVIYLHRRFLPQPEDVPSSRDFETLDRHVRLDTVAYVAIGDPLAYWKVCDANCAMNPFDLVEENGGRLRVPAGGAKR